MLIAIFAGVSLALILIVFASLAIQTLSFPTEFVDALYIFGYNMGLVNNFLPVSELIGTLQFVFNVILATIAFRVGLYLIALLRGNSMPGNP